MINPADPSTNRPFHRPSAGRARADWGGRWRAGVLLLVPAIALCSVTGSSVAKEASGCSGDRCAYVAGGTACYAKVNIAAQEIIAGYDGKVTVNFSYVADKEWWGDFTANFKLYVSNVQVDAAGPFSGDQTGKLSYEFSSDTGSTNYTVKLTADLTGEKSCSDWDVVVYKITRPECTSSTTLNSLYNYYQNSSTVNISGTVKDTGCGHTPLTANGVVRLTVYDPTGDFTNSPNLDLFNGQFSWTYTLPSPKLGHYGTYTVKATYDGQTQPHVIDASTDTEDFELLNEIALPGPPWGSGVAWGVPYGTGEQILQSIQGQQVVLVIPVEGSLPTVSIPTTALAAPPQGTETTTDFRYPLRSDNYPLIALTKAGADSVVFLDIYGNRAWEYPVAVPAPCALAFDGAALWVASYLPNGPLRRVDLVTGAPLRTLNPGIGQIADLAWDAITQTLLAVSEGRPVIYRLSPTSGTVIEQVPLRSPNHRSILTYQTEIRVGETTSQMLYLWGQTPGTPGTPGTFSVTTEDALPAEIALRWSDPDQVPPWTGIRIYRDGSLLDTVLPGEEEFVDGAVAEHAYHSYWIVAHRDLDAADGAPSDTLGCYARHRPPLTLRVPSEYGSIQGAIYGAMDDDTVLVAPGTYPGGVLYNGRNVKVLSSAGPGSTTLSGADLPFSIVAFDSTEGAGALLSGFTLTGSELMRKGVVRCGPDAAPILRDNVIAGNTVWHEGGGILCEGEGVAGPTIENNTIAHNQFLASSLGQFQGGGICCRDAPAVVEKNIVAFNSHGWGIYVDGGTFPTLSCNDLWENELGAYRGCGPGGQDLAVDPLFCSPGDLRLCANSPCIAGGGCGLIGALGAGCGACAGQIDFADHAVGNCVLTVTERGILGFLDGSQTQGSGFVYPAGGSNLLYIGGFWIGLDPAHVVNRDYDADPAKEWTVSVDPDGHLWTDGHGFSDQDHHAIWTDAGAAAPRSIRVHQESWAFASPPDDDFVILRYFVENGGASPLGGIYAGLFLDLDLGDALANRGGSDAGRHLVYVNGATGPYAGASLIMGVRAPDGEPVHDAPANLTLVTNRTYVWPSAYIPDADKYAFLAASDPAHVLPAATTPDDYGVVVSAGPFDLAPGAVREISFAILGGENLPDLQANADRAAVRYLFPTGVPEEARFAFETRLLGGVPNPSTGATSIRFTLARPAEARIDLFDAGGRLILPLLRSRLGAGSHSAVWDGRDSEGRRVASGVYYIRLAAGGRQDGGTIVLLR
jgi:hypothetical protein